MISTCRAVLKADSLAGGVLLAGGRPSATLSTAAGLCYSSLEGAEHHYSQDKFTGEVYRQPRYLLQERYKDGGPAVDEDESG